MSESVSRRGFWLALGRAAGGGALAGLAGYLGLREGSDGGPRIHAPCRRCGVLSRCSYPQAGQTRIALGDRGRARVARGKSRCPYRDA